MPQPSGRGGGAAVGPTRYCAQEVFASPCRCGDRYCVTEAELDQGVDVVVCDTCSLKIRVLYDEAAPDQEVCAHVDDGGSDGGGAVGE